jgi:hypothetical protein
MYELAYLSAVFVSSIQGLEILAVGLRNVPAQYNHESLLVGVWLRVLFPLERWVEIKLRKICQEEVPHLKGLIVASTIKHTKPV